MVLIRVDCNKSIGMGHVNRCTALANELARRSIPVLFVVSDDESAMVLEGKGQKTEVLAADPMRLAASDARQLVDLACDWGARAIILDSYGMTDGFFDGLAEAKTSIQALYMDDSFTYEHGLMDNARIRPVDVQVNYMWGADESVLESEGNCPQLLIGPRYAPIASAIQGDYHVRNTVDHLLITSGSTNPDGALEKMATAVAEVLPHADVCVVVGPLASFDDASCPQVQTIRGVTDLTGAMLASDLVVSAAGTTLYELAHLGVPTVAVSLVENQVRNAQGFERWGLGMSADLQSASSRSLASAVQEMAASYALRSKFSTHMREVVDGQGARRIVDAL